MTDGTDCAQIWARVKLEMLTDTTYDWNLQSSKATEMTEHHINNHKSRHVL